MMRIRHEDGSFTVEPLNPRSPLRFFMDFPSGYCGLRCEICGTTLYLDLNAAPNQGKAYWAWMEGHVRRHSILQKGWWRLRRILSTL